MSTVMAIVPSYNHGPFIEERILSILGQNSGEFDIRLIVIDDHSTDGSDEVINRLRTSNSFEYIRLDANSGTPFSAWAKAASFGHSDFVWICESDDVAGPDFLGTALARFKEAPDAVLFYCNSNVIDERGAVVGTTASYFEDVWQDPRWGSPFRSDGRDELARYQYRGMTVPNMSSALIAGRAFVDSYSPFLKRFALTGDWLFIGRIMTHGSVVFDPSIHNSFRQHAQTSRARTVSARSQAEFVITKFRLHRLARKPLRNLAQTLKLDATRFIYEPASPWRVMREMWRVSRLDTLGLLAALPYSLLFHPTYLARFLRRRRSAKATG